MRTIAYTTLHYGASYLEAAIRSIIDRVDEYYCLYTPTGSFGYRTWKPCPESAEDLLDIARRAAGAKLRWLWGTYRSEGEHREQIYHVGAGADRILAVDADEIWREDQLERLFRDADETGARLVRARGIHFWRSFKRAVIDDYAAPVRLVQPKAKRGETVSQAWFAHMGYAQPAAIVEYKQHVHGHRAEWRDEWFAERFLPNAQVDVHPTNINYWTPVEVNPRDYLPGWVVDSHPFADKEVVE